MQSNTSMWERRLAFLLAFIIVLFFFYFLIVPQQIAEFTLPIIRLLAASMAGCAGYLFTGSLNLEGKLPGNGLTVRAGGAFAAFLLVFYLFYSGIPSSSSPARGLFNRTVISNEILNQMGTTPQGYPIVATENGTGVQLSVSLDSIPRSIERSKYQIVAFARVNDNPNWSSQGIKPLSESPSPFELMLWNDPAGDQKLYEAITIISSTFNDHVSRTYTEDEVKSFEQKRSDTLIFYRDDSQ